MNNLLCFRVLDNTYGLRLEDVKESFASQKVTAVPCLNHVFKGLCNHNGIIYPVISFSLMLGNNDNNLQTCMLLIQVNKYQLILEITDVPFIAYKSEIISDTPYTGGTANVKIERLAKLENDLIYVLNMSEILDNLNILESPK